MPSLETGIATPYNPLDLPCGGDRADGVAAADGVARLGTPSATGQILAQSAKGSGVTNLPIEEEKDSPFIEFGEQDTIKHRYRMEYNEAVTRALGLRRGVIRTDSYGDLWKILSTSVQRSDGGKATLETTEECMSGDTPPDRFEVVPVELGLHIIKHPRYVNAFLGNPDIPLSLVAGDTTGGYGSTTEKKNQMVIRLLQDYMENTSAPWRNAIQEMLVASLNSEAGVGAQQPPLYDATTQAYTAGDKVAGTDMAKAAACEIIVKYWRGEEVPSVVGLQLTWTQYFWFPYPLNPGGYIEDPITEGGLPDFLWDCAFPPSESDAGVNDIFFMMAAFNPQSYSRDGRFGFGDKVQISWRREADQEVRERTFFGIQHRWVGSPIGHWDPQLYTQNDAPRKKENFLSVLKSDGTESWTYDPTT